MRQGSARRTIKPTGRVQVTGTKLQIAASAMSSTMFENSTTLKLIASYAYRARKHVANRFELGEQMYETLGIPREDKAGRFGHLARNYPFFDAPVGLFCFIDRGMGPPQWADLGMFLQTFMLLCTERGLDTCPQAAFTQYHRVIAEELQLPANEMVVCGMALGWADPDEPVNALRSTRVPVSEFASFHHG